MKKLTKQQEEELRKLLDKLGGLDPASEDAAKVKEELDEITNKVAEVSNKVYQAEEKVKKPKEAKVINKSKRQKQVKSQVIQAVDVKTKEAKAGIRDLDEEELLDTDTFIELTKSLVELNQQCADYTLVLLENSNDMQVGRIKKCIENNIENKRQLKQILKECIDAL